MHVRKNDQVMVITGKDKNTKGKITVAFPKTGKVIVEGVNMVTRHQKARNAMQPGGIVKKEAAIDASNVMLRTARWSASARSAAPILTEKEEKSDGYPY